MAKRRRKQDKKRGPTPPKKRARPVMPVPEAVDGLGAFAEAIWGLAESSVWSVLEPEDLIRVQVPSLGVELGCLCCSNVGGERELVLYPNIAMQNAFVEGEAFGAEAEEGEPISRRYTASLAPGRRLPTWMWEAVRGHELSAGQSLYPLVTGERLGGELITPSALAIGLLTAAARVLPDFVESHRRLFEEGEGPMAEARYDEGAAGLAIVLSAPCYESYALHQQQGPPPPVADHLDEAKRKELSAGLVEGMVATFAAEPHGALGCATPAQAVTTPRGKRRVKALLAYLEAWRSPLGDDRIDVGRLRDQLGLGEG